VRTKREDRAALKDGRLRDTGLSGSSHARSRLSRIDSFLGRSSGIFWFLRPLLVSKAARGALMPVSGPSVLTWGHRVLGVAVGTTGSRLRARVAAMAACGRRPVEQQRPAATIAPSGAVQQPPNPPTTVAGPATTTAPQAHREPTVPTRVATASVTPAMVRRWAHEQGIQVADRGRIPQSLMTQYLAQVARPAAGGRRPSRASSSKATRRSSGRSRSSAA
jgi:hypothetical protein